MDMFYLYLLGLSVAIILGLSLTTNRKQKKRHSKRIDEIKKKIGIENEINNQKIFDLYDKIKGQNKLISDLKASLENERKKSCIDSLTGIYNRRYLDENAQRKIDLIERFGKPVTFLYMDLDKFKEINDTLGHKMGDDILQKVAGKIKSIARHTDTYARLGGDEFFIILPGTSIEQVSKFSERLEKEIANIPRELGIDFPNFGVSIGAIGHIPGVSFEESMKMADAMMYRVKESRRKK